MAENNSPKAIPLLTSVFFICRERLASSEPYSLSLIGKRLDKFLDTYSVRYTVRQGCWLGFSRRALDYLAARDLEWNVESKIVEKAVFKGFLHVIEWLGERYPDRVTWTTVSGGSLMDIAAEFGHLQVVQWLHDNRGEGCTTKAMDRAAAVGNLEIVRWLHLNRNEGCTKQAMNVAAAHGHLALVEWLNEHRSEGCDKSAITFAAANGHLAVVRFLLENRREGSAGDAMCEAASNGHLDIVQWLYANRGDNHVGTALRCAAKNGRAVVVEWLFWIVLDQRRGVSIIRDAARIALKEGKKKVAKQLERNLERSLKVEPDQPIKRSKRRCRRY